VVVIGWVVGKVVGGKVVGKVVGDSVEITHSSQLAVSFGKQCFVKELK
jgi:hypothetical protein